MDELYNTPLHSCTRSHSFRKEESETGSGKYSKFTGRNTCKGSLQMNPLAECFGKQEVTAEHLRRWGR